MRRTSSVIQGLLLGALACTTTFAPAQSAQVAAKAKTRLTPQVAAACTNQFCTSSLTHNFGAVIQGSSAAYGVAVTNGYSTPQPFSVSLSGSSSISVTGNSCGTLIAAGATCELVFTYKAPNDREADTTSVALASGVDSFNNGTSGSLYGYTTPNTGTSGGAIYISTNGHNFGATNVNTPQWFGWNIQNSSSSPQAISITSTGSKGFSPLLNGCPSTLAAGQSCDISFLYAPTGTASENAVYTLHASIPVYLKGTTTAANTLTLIGYGTGTVNLNQAIQHVIVIFPENISFDHYYGTYPIAANQDGTTFSGTLGNNTINNYNCGGVTPCANSSLLTANPNLSNSGNGNGATNPYRLSYAQGQATASQSHNYNTEQEAENNSAMNAFPEYVGKADSAAYPGGSGISATTGLNLGYYDGNVVTALWNYAQRFSLSDSHYGTGFGPSTNGAINVISGQTNGVGAKTGTSNLIADGQGGYTLYGDDDPYADTCSTKSGTTVQMTGKNIGDLLNSAGVTWGSFMGGFNLGITNPNGTTGCLRSTTGKAQSSTNSAPESDYIQHHAWFQYYASTANYNHNRPASTSAIGTASDTCSTAGCSGSADSSKANHEYDIQDFFTVLSAGNLPAVSYLKSQAYQDAHPGNSDPLDEQAFITSVINAVMQTQYWPNTAIIITYDDSDGWYDHVYNAPVNGSFTSVDFLNSSGNCGVNGTTAQLPGPNSNGNPVQGRCGLGPRIPLTIVSPWAKKNYIDHTVINQASVVRFIEDHMLGAARIGGGSFDASSNVLDNMFDLTHGSAPNVAPLILNSTTGAAQ